MPGAGLTGVRPGWIRRQVLAFFRLAARELSFRYILKVDDDVYFRPLHLPAALARWRGAEYVGCFRRRGRVHVSPAHKFFEHGHQILGQTYFTYATGSTYAVESSTAALLAGMPAGSLRVYGCGDDCSLGLWLIALNAAVLEDQSLCRWTCEPGAVSVRHHGKCGGLCHPAQDIPRLHSDSGCSMPPPEGLPGNPPANSSLWMPPCFRANAELSDTTPSQEC